MSQNEFLKNDKIKEYKKLIGNKNNYNMTRK